MAKEEACDENELWGTGLNKCPSLIIPHLLLKHEQIVHIISEVKDYWRK